MEASHKQSTNEIFWLLAYTIIIYIDDQICVLCICVYISFNCTLVQFYAFSIRKSTKEVIDLRQRANNKQKEKRKEIVEKTQCSCWKFITGSVNQSEHWLLLLNHIHIANGPGYFFPLFQSYPENALTLVTGCRCLSCLLACIGWTADSDKLH